MSLSNIPFETLLEYFEPEHYILLFDVSKEFRHKVCKSIKDESDFLSAAINLNVVHFMKWWKYKGYSFPDASEDYINLCIEKDSLDMAQWIFDNLESPDDDVPDSYCGFYFTAVKHENIRFLDWIYSKDEYHYLVTDTYSFRNTKNNEVRQWLHQHGIVIGNRSLKISK